MSRLAQLVSPEAFHRWCAALALIWLATAVPVSLVLRPYGGDFPQYYMGGVIAQAGAWEDLYPEPTAKAGHNAGLGASIARPRYAELARQRGVAEGEPKFILPPPLAIVFQPLAWFEYGTAAWVWTGVLILGAWITAVCAGDVVRLSLGRPTHVSGLVMLLIAISPLAVRAIRSGNMTCMLAGCVGLTVVGLVRQRNVVTAAALYFAGFAKYAAGILGPVVLARRAWGAVLWMMIFAIITAMTMLITGAQPYVVYVREILPTIGGAVYIDPNNQALSAMIARMMGGPEAFEAAPMIARVIRMFGFAALAGILCLIWAKRRDIQASPRQTFAACAVLFAWWPLVSPLFWAHYFMYLAPMLGWVIAEAMRSRRLAWVAALIVGPMWLSMAVMRKLSLPEPLNSNMFFSAMLLLGFSIWFLARARNAHALQCMSVGAEATR